MFFNRINLQFLIGFTAVCLVVSCQKTTTHTYKTPGEFFGQAKFGGDYFNTLPFFSPDSVVKRMATDVPLSLIGKACESAYFRFPELPDSLYLTYLDKIEAAFPHDSIHAFAQLMRGHILTLTAQYDTAEICLKDCYDISIRDNRPIRASDAQVYMGSIAALRGDYPEAIRLQVKAYEVFMRLYPEDGGRVYDATMTIGRVYSNIEDYESAKLWHKKLISLLDTNPDTRGMYIRTLAQLAVDFSRNQQHDSAKILIDSVFMLEKRYNFTYEMCIRRLYRAEIATANGQFKAAIPDFSMAQNDSFCLNIPSVMGRVYLGLARAYDGIGQADSAIALYNKALKTPDTLGQSKICLSLANLYEKRRNYNLALDYERRGHNLRSRILTAQKDKTLERMKLQNETAHHIQTIEYQQKTTRFRLVIGLLIFAFLFISTLFFAYRQQQKRLSMAQEKALAEAREQLKTQALTEAEKTIEKQEKTIETQEIILQESVQLLSFKDTLIENLQIRLAEQTELQSAEAVPQVVTNPPQNTPLLRGMRILTAEDWGKFRALFDGHFPNFSIKLKEKFPQLTLSEVRLVLLIKASFEPYEIASVLGISYQSVYTSRYRLRKKLNLQGENDLETLILSF